MTTKPRHGTRYHYNLGCRCDECRDASNRYAREQRARRKALNRPSYARELAAGRALKERYRGTCVDCGKPTTGCFGPGKAPERCNPCQAKLTGASFRGKGSRNSHVLRLLESGPMRFMEIQRATGVRKEQVSLMLLRLLRYGLIERPERGVYVLTRNGKDAA